jgi:putative ABC transport system permease protein
MMARVFSFWRNLLNRTRVEHELDEEMRTSFELLVDDKIRTGLSVEHARRAAGAELRIESVKEQVRAVRAGSFMETLLQDSRYAARLLRRNPLFTLTAALSLAIGIGGASAVFSVANGLVLTVPAGVSDPTSLVDIARVQSGDVGVEPITYPAYVQVQRATTTLAGVYGYALNLEPLSLRGPAGAERIFGGFVTMSFFDVLGVRPTTGRLFGRGDPDQPQASPFVVLSHAFWTRRFNRDPTVIGRTLPFNGYPLTIVGVADERFRGMSVLAPDVWIPAVMIPALTPGVSVNVSPAQGDFPWPLMMGARLKPGVSRAEASTEIAAIGKTLEREMSPKIAEIIGAMSGQPVNVQMEWRVVAASPIPAGLRLPVAGFLALLMALMAVVLAIACANLAGVLLARATERRKEIALRVAIGAGRARVVRQFLTEVVLLFLLGGSAGVLVALVMTPLLISFVPADPMPVAISAKPDGTMVLFALTLSLLAALLSGLMPALQASRSDVVSGLKDEAQGPDHRRLRSAFVVAQVAFSLLLVVVAAIFVRGFNRVTSFTRGFDARAVEVASMDLGMAQYTHATGPVFTRELLARVRSLPGIEHATIADRAPGPQRRSMGGLTVPGLSPPAGQRYFFADWTVVDSGYFETLSIPLVSGRDFTASDASGTQPVAIVGAAAARRFWPGQDAVGQTLLVSAFDIDGSGKAATPLTIVGVVGDVRLNDRGNSAPLALYVPGGQRYLPQVSIIARTTDGRSLSREFHELVSSLNPNLPLLDAQPLERLLNGPVEAQLRIAASIAGSVGIVGLLLASIGIYGVTAYTVTRRTREIGIRLSLGAPKTAVVGMVVRQAAILLALGSAIGLVLGAAAGRVLSSGRFGVPPPDALMFIGAASLFAVVGLVACYVPVRRATRIGAVEALRYE